MKDSKSGFFCLSVRFEIIQTFPFLIENLIENLIDKMVEQLNRGERCVGKVAKLQAPFRIRVEDNNKYFSVFELG
jgi:hypothetical protein